MLTIMIPTWFTTIPMTREHSGLAGRASIIWQEDLLKQYDAALITTDHDIIDYRKLCEAAPLSIVDTATRANAPAMSRRQCR